MKKYKVIVSSTIYYEADIEAESIADIHKQFKEGDLDFTSWQEVGLDSNIYDIVEVNT
jgi:hypothetical protein